MSGFVVESIGTPDGITQSSDAVGPWSGANRNKCSVKV